MSEPADTDLRTLITRLSQDTAELIRTEIALAKAETLQTARRGALGAGLLAGSGVIGLLALGSLSRSVEAAFGRALDPPGAALATAALWTGISGGLAASGVTALRRAGNPLPEQTLESVKEDAAWAKSRTSSANR